jgi:hypothetical protein
MKVQFLEDNTTAVRAITSGKNPSMKHMTRTHRIDFAFLHETVANGHVVMYHCPSEYMCADIFTKHFTRVPKWQQVLDNRTQWLQMTPQQRRHLTLQQDAEDPYDPIQPNSGVVDVWLMDDQTIACDPILANAVIDAVDAALFDDGRVRTIVSQWNQSPSQQGWSLGISGLGSRRKPRMPVLQLTGILPDGKSATEAIFSDLQIQLDRSYYLSAAIHFAPDGKAEVTFRLKDLSNDDEPLRVTSAPHPFASPPLSSSPLVIGNSHGPDPRPWDGLIDEIRLRRGLISDSSSALTQPALSPDTLACWSFVSPL